MFPYSYSPMPEDDYEQYLRAQQRQRQRQAYEHQQHQYYEYLRQQQLREQEQRRYRAIQEHQLREQERLKRLEREQQERWQRQALLQERERQRKQQLAIRQQQQLRAQQAEAERQRRAQIALAEKRRLAAQKQHEQQLREQFVNRHQDGPITMSLFDVLDYIQRGQQRPETPRLEAPRSEGRSEGRPVGPSTGPSVGRFDRLDNGPTYSDDEYDEFESAISPEDQPKVSEPPSPRVEFVEDLIRGLGGMSFGQNPMYGGSRAPKAYAKPQPPQSQAPAANRPAPISYGPPVGAPPAREPKKSQAQIDAENTALLRTLKPRIDLEQERYQAIKSKPVDDAESAKIKLQNLKEAHSRVESIYQQLDQLKVSRQLRNQKHDLTSTAVRLADSIDDSIAEVRPQLAEYQASEPPSPALSATESVESAAAKHHVTLEEVEDEYE